MATPASRLSVAALLDFDVLETARALEYQLREIESLCQEAKTTRNRNWKRRKALDKELAALNVQLHQEISMTQKLASKLQMVTAGASWFSEKALFDVLHSQTQSDLHDPDYDTWQCNDYYEPARQHASSFIQQTEPYNESYVFSGSGSCTSPLPFDTIDHFNFSPPTINILSSNPCNFPLPPSSDTFSVDLAAYVVPASHYSGNLQAPLGSDTRRPLSAIQEEDISTSAVYEVPFDDGVEKRWKSEGGDFDVLMANVPRKKLKVRDVSWRNLWSREV
ncbi:hypothetical protein BDZ89DRAFT_1143901 [Hymenopellis radicata]|nr:hypothetical protein BDZ89DRAFT_1143901 [Hymenopellis radicata]